MNQQEQLSVEYLQHHLRLLGLQNSDEIGHQYLILVSASDSNLGQAQEAVKAGKVVIVIQPSRAFSAAFGVEQVEVEGTLPISLDSCQVVGSKKRNLRTFNSIFSFSCRCGGESVITDESGAAVWLSVAVDSGFVLFVGSDVAGDILRFRQGDPSQAEVGQSGSMWGIPGERPNYLYEKQLEGLPHGDRQADYWAWLLANYISNKAGIKLSPMLPQGALGAVVITGDDDQAYLEKYAEQLELLKNAPITYFLHPLTRHTSKTLKSMLGKKTVDLGIHPDALDQPTRYSELLKEQCAWFSGLVKRYPVSVRNHGFLNDGYWGHLPSWLSEGIRWSSNIPGLNGRVLNGSLLPARVVYDGKLTSHWSVLTAIGDGVRFISGMTDEDAAECITTLAQSIREEGIPGIIVLNLHPQNVSETKAMHLAAKEVIDSGFVAWTVRDCLEWFDRIDGNNYDRVEDRENFWHGFAKTFRSRLSLNGLRDQ